MCVCVCIYIYVYIYNAYVRLRPLQARVNPNLHPNPS